MKKSIQLLLLLSVVFIITDRVVGYGLKKLDEKVFTGQGVGKVNQFLTLKDSVDLLVFGSSRAVHHVDNMLLSPSSYNVGIDGTKIFHSAVLISTLRKKGQNILVHIDHNRLYDSKYNGEDLLGLKNLIPRNKDVKENIYRFFPEEIILSKVSNSYIYNGKVLGMFKNYFAPSYNYVNYHGYDPLTPSEEQKLIFQKLMNENKRPFFKKGDLDLKTPNPKIDDFIDIIKDVSQKNNSNLIFFTSPNLKTIDKGFRDKTKSYFESKGLIYYDYSNFIDSKDINCWKDFTHMSHKGAIKFTKELKKHLILEI